MAEAHPMPEAGLLTPPVLNPDVLVIGGGPAGIAAATEIARLGGDVVMVDENPRPGGQIWRHRVASGRPASSLPKAAQRAIEAFTRSGAQARYGATVFDLDTSGAARVEIEGRAIHIHPRRGTILCTGSRERFLPFPGWTLPGVMGVGGVQALLKSGVEVQGRRVVLGGTGPLLLPVAQALVQAGATLEVVLEQLSFSRLAGFALTLMGQAPGRLVDGARYRAGFLGTRFRTGSWVEQALAGPDGRVSGARIRVGGGEGPLREIPCDLVCVGYGLVPAVELARLAGCQITPQGGVQVDAHQQTSNPRIFAAGEPTGVGGVQAAQVEGAIAGAQIMETTPAGSLRRAQARHLRFKATLESTFAIDPAILSLPDASTVVCRCEGVTHGQIVEAGSYREAKIVHRMGMGPCQGKVCGTTVRTLYGWDRDTVQLPATPVPLRSLASPDARS
jgi:NADPH-dependent 2,4-dienoyl-CoA reductase/sulfur reductase-like enzyme